MRALLVQPPVYDTQYYAEWSMPSGLLKVATWLREIGYDIRLVDCLYPDAAGNVKHEIRKIVQVCSTVEWTLADYRTMVKERTVRPPSSFRPITATSSSLDCRCMQSKSCLRHKSSERFFEDERWIPDEVWITSIMTYWCESTSGHCVADEAAVSRRPAFASVASIRRSRRTTCAMRLLLRVTHFEVVRGRDLVVERIGDQTVVRTAIAL